jgi:hypothetical protein
VVFGISAPFRLRDSAGFLRDPSSGPDDKRDANAGAPQHLDQAVYAEALDPAAHEIADARLSDTEQPGGPGLGQAPGVNQPGELNHQVGAKSQVLRFFAAETRVAKNVS